MLADFDRGGFIQDLDIEARHIYWRGVEMQWLEAYPNLKEKNKSERRANRAHEETFPKVKCYKKVKH